MNKSGSEKIYLLSRDHTSPGSSGYRVMNGYSEALTRKRIPFEILNVSAYRHPGLLGMLLEIIFRLAPVRSHALHP